MTVTLGPRVCPFCGLPADVPHETQAGCIEALREEIDRTRQVLDCVKESEAARPPGEDAEVA